MSITDYAQHFLGKPYIWGGQGADGFDCSGLVIECLQAFGLLPSGDWTADTLSAKLVTMGWHQAQEPHEGDVVFFGDPKYTHVALMVNAEQYIEAGGGGSKCTSVENSTGLVRLRPLTWRKPDLILRR